MNAQPPPRLIIVTGLSGAGKNSVLRALEDVGYEAVDNPPLRVVDTLIGSGKPLAIGIDIRTRDFSAKDIIKILKRLRENTRVQPELVFVTARSAALQRRFTETRRRHPLALAGTIKEGIKTEVALTVSLRDAADHVIDTSDLTLPNLRQMIEKRFGHHGLGMSITLASFAFPAGVPQEANLVFDARFLSNPHYIPDLRLKTGLDMQVRAYIECDPDYSEFFDRLNGMVGFLLPRFVREGKKYVMIAVGCTGGQHRSVAIVEALGTKLRGQNWQVQIEHRAIRSRMSKKTSDPVSPPVGETDSQDVQKFHTSGKSGHIRRHPMTGASK